jgi:hypothetical protein
VVKLQHALPRLEHLAAERQHLPAEHVVRQGQPTHVSGRLGRRAGLGAHHLQGDALLHAVLVRAAE